MSRERALVVLVAADIFFAFTGMGIETFFGWTLPGPLRDHARWSGVSGFRQFGLLVLWGMTAACAVTAWIGLLNYWWFARRLYVVACVATILLTLSSGPTVSTALGAALDRLNWLVGGAIFGLVYFSDLSHRFERSPAEVTNGARANA